MNAKIGGTIRKIIRIFANKINKRTVINTKIWISINKKMKDYEI